MALKLANVVDEMKQVVTGAAEVPEWRRCDRILELAGDFLVRGLARDPENGQVAVLMVLTDYNQLTFAFPGHLARGNSLPIDRNSLAGRVVMDKRTVIENNVPEQPHKSFYERIPDEAGVVRSIQKMVAAPLLDRQNDVLGVIEVSRTGGSPSSSGPDFTSSDAENLKTCCRVFAPFVARTWAQRQDA